MLLADKTALQSQLKLSILQIEDKVRSGARRLRPARRRAFTAAPLRPQSPRAPTTPNRSRPSRKRRDKSAAARVKGGGGRVIAITPPDEAVAAGGSEWRPSDGGLDDGSGAVPATPSVRFHEPPPAEMRTPSPAGHLPNMEGAESRVRGGGAGSADARGEARQPRLGRQPSWNSPFGKRSSARLARSSTVSRLIDQSRGVRRWSLRSPAASPRPSEADAAAVAAAAAERPPENRTERALNYLHNLPDKLVNAAAAVLPTPGI